MGSSVTPADISRAMAVHSVDDETRVRTSGDETDVVADGSGELQCLDDEGAPVAAPEKRAR
jgi:hypothetical protein